MRIIESHQRDKHGKTNMRFKVQKKRAKLKETQIGITKKDLAKSYKTMSHRKFQNEKVCRGER